MYKGLTEAKRPRRIVTKIEPALSDHLRRGWLRFWKPSPLCLRLIHPSNASLCHPLYLVCDQILFMCQLLVARASSNFAHAPAYPCSRVIKNRSRVIKFCSRTSFLLLARHQILFTHQLIIARVSSNFDHARGKKHRASSKFDHTSSKFDHARHSEPLAPSNFVHVRDKKTHASSRFDHARDEKALESSNFDHVRYSEALASSKFVRTHLIFSRTPRDRPRQ